MTGQGRTWRIGELARQSGLTVRTLYHYDQLGLLSPLSRTGGGHRCYTSGGVRRLHRIVALRSLSDEDFAALRRKMKDAWNAMSRQEQQRMTQQRREMIPHL